VLEALTGQRCPPAWVGAEQEHAGRAGLPSDPTSVAPVLCTEHRLEMYNRIICVPCVA